ncbi:MAG: hypothetical protein M0Z87_09200, partial [Actinomycetota bacterium]|nr:hypothetical protein [Actinomycetota bacterium]
MDPGHEDREDALQTGILSRVQVPQWSPVTKTGKTQRDVSGVKERRGAVMDPGHEGRHDHNGTGATTTQTLGPQWSPVMKTGKTGARIEPTIASLEPQWSPVVKTGEDVLVRKGSP